MTVLIDYGAGNTKSVMNALDRIGAPYILSSDKEIIDHSSRLILPGVGHAAAAMEQLKSRNLISTLRNYRKPFLGICLGMQLMFDHSEEGATPCLGLIPGIVKKFISDSVNKVPHMGWNDFTNDKGHYIFDGTDGANEAAYFVHSYYVSLSEYTISSCNYIIPFSAAVSFENFTGIQFHPEKSGAAGQNILYNFTNLAENNAN
ncbi:MAG: imidazole glycerol phosphate synthase subunit HisH [Saprospiraceae bacterium]|nr:imidazole glycerol phosphate synthase subunit HisH [Saprospiraceae bacterium]